MKATQTTMMVLLLLLLLSPMTTVVVKASFSNEEGQEQEQQFPFTVPPTTATEEDLQLVEQEQEEPPTVAELIQRYGANQSDITLTPQMLDQVGQKAVVLTFDDNWESQYSYVEPILTNNGFNATFFIYCLGLEQGPEFMTAQQLRDLHAKGYDIQSHSMTHPNLLNASQEQLDFEISVSKQCIEELVPGLEVEAFATPFAVGADNATILESIRDAGYEYSRVGYGGNFHLGCDADWYNQTAGCQLYEENGTMKFQNRFNIPTADANGISRENNHDLNATQATFEREINDALTYDVEGKLAALPVLVYHNFSNRVLPPEQMGQSMLAESFAQQMQYLKDNNFVVLSLKDLTFDTFNETFAVPTRLS